MDRGFDALRQAETLAEALGDQRRLGQLCDSISHHCWRMGAYDDAIAYGQRALSAASGDVLYQAHAHSLLGTYYFSLGAYRRAIDELRQSMAALEGELRHMRIGMMVYSVRTRSWLAECLAELGEFTEGIACAAEAARIAEAAAHLGSAILAQYGIGRVALHQGNLQHAIPILERALAQCRVMDVRLYLPGITGSLGLAYALSGRVAEALPLFDQVVVSEDTGLGRGSALMFSLGEVYLLAGRLADALQLAERALVLSRGRKERGHHAWTLRLLGAIVLHGNSPNIALAETHYRQALALAEELGMRPLVALGHAGLGTLYAKIDRWEQARTELAAAIELYRTMAMTFWLPRTEATLAQVLGMSPEAAHPTEGPRRHLTMPVQFTKTPEARGVMPNG